MISPLYGQLSPLRVPTKQRVLTDTAAISYIAAVEAADGAKLEDTVRFAYEDFILGCKSDGTWNAIKASCILAGARTLAGALVPLVGPAPTNLNFVSADYNRKTGLISNGSTKWINANYLNNADGVTDCHIYCMVENPLTPLATPRVLIGSSDANSNRILQQHTTTTFRRRCNTINNTPTHICSIGGYGVSRNNNINYSTLMAGVIGSVATANNGLSSSNIGVFANGFGTSIADARISFYSIGSFLDLSILNNRVALLMNAIRAIL